MNEAYPPDVTDILMDTEEDSDSDEALDGESDSDYDSDQFKNELVIGLFVQCQVNTF